MAQENQDKLSQQEQQAIDLGAATTRTSRGTIYTLTIVGQIEGHQVLPETVKTTKYEHVLPLLAAVEESEEIDGLLLLLNTGTRHCRADRGHEKAHGVIGARRRTLDRHSAGRLGPAQHDRAHGQYDGAPRAHDGYGHRRAADIPLF